MGELIDVIGRRSGWMNGYVCMYVCKFASHVCEWNNEVGR